MASEISIHSRLVQNAAHGDVVEDHSDHHNDGDDNSDQSDDENKAHICQI